MELTAYFDEENNVVVTTPVGEVTLENVKATTREALILSEKHTCYSLLFDIRQCPIGQSLSDGFWVMQDMKETLGLDYRYRVAIVYNPEIYPQERAQFIENVVVNRGNPNFKLYIELDQALAWLRQVKK
jgi:hypothetical protein